MVGVRRLKKDRLALKNLGNLSPNREVKCLRCLDSFIFIINSIIKFYFVVIKTIWINIETINIIFLLFLYSTGFRKSQYFLSEIQDYIERNERGLIDRYIRKQSSILKSLNININLSFFDFLYSKCY